MYRSREDLIIVSKVTNQIAKERMLIWRIIKLRWWSVRIDGQICTMTEEEKKGQGCWLCPKIQGVWESKNERDGKEINNGRKETKEWIGGTRWADC